MPHRTNIYDWREAVKNDVRYHPHPIPTNLTEILREALNQPLNPPLGDNNVIEDTYTVIEDYTEPFTLTMSTSQASLVVYTGKFITARHIEAFLQWFFTFRAGTQAAAVKSNLTYKITYFEAEKARVITHNSLESFRSYHKNALNTIEDLDI